MPSVQKPTTSLMSASTSHTPEMQAVAPYVVNQVTKFLIKEKVFHPDNFEVLKLPDSTLSFDIRGNVLARDCKKIILDQNANKLFAMTEDVNTLLQVMYIFDYRTRRVYTLRKKGFFPGFGRSSLFVWEGKGDSGNPLLEITCTAFRTKFNIVDRSTNLSLATFTRSAGNAKRVLTGADTYVLTVLPGMDSAFLTMLVVCCDEHYSDFSR